MNDDETPITSPRAFALAVVAGFAIWCVLVAYPFYRLLHGASHFEAFGYFLAELAVVVCAALLAIYIGDRVGGE